MNKVRNAAVALGLAGLVSVGSSVHFFSRAAPPIVQSYNELVTERSEIEKDISAYDRAILNIHLDKPKGIEARAYNGIELSGEAVHTKDYLVALRCEKEELDEKVNSELASIQANRNYSSWRSGEIRNAWMFLGGFLATYAGGLLFVSTFDPSKKRK